MVEEDVIAKAVAQAKQFVADGADIIDIGGESTRPGSSPISAEEELARVLPVVQAVRQAVDVVISIDSYRASVAEAALAAGASWLNDVRGLRMDPDMAGLAAQAGCPIVLMHNRSKPKNIAGSVAKIVKLEHAWRRLDGRNDDGFQVAPFPG